MPIQKIVCWRLISQLGELSKADMDVHEAFELLGFDASPGKKAITASLSFTVCLLLIVIAWFGGVLLLTASGIMVD